MGTMKSVVKLLLLGLLMFILLPWELFAPVVKSPVVIAPQEATTALPIAAVPVTSTSLVSEKPVPPPAKPLSSVNPPPPKPTPKPVVYNEAYSVELERAIHDRINAERVRAGLGILTYNDTLAQVAALHSTDMAEENYFAHEDENGCTSSCRVTKIGYDWRSVGENLFLLKSSNRYSVEDASAIIVQGWMGSEGHRHNVLYDNFTQEGIGVVIKGDAIYATEVFARPR